MASPFGAASAAYLLVSFALPSMILLSRGVDGTNIYGYTTESGCQALAPSPSLSQFVDSLAFPPTIDISSLTSPQQLTLGAYRIMQKLHRDLPSTPMYAFGTSRETASSPGPTLLKLHRDLPSTPMYAFGTSRETASSPGPTLLKLHRDLPSTPMYAFGTSRETASSPGPTLLKLHRDLPSTPMYAFGTSRETASSPGPTLL
ncbi:hypothetical protein KP509_37G045900 [Ceratopteris richardii]|uniref:Uncharacterized protein n=1 Tax=Ceratopteris richardii TaxID=49495 RepID=A0A8T2Q8I8_CERRI|nr:hypothetical protein KP509_37G045900 [Ceratopteris richardii]